MFYQLCVASGENLRKKLRLQKDPASYEYLKSCTVVPGIDDVKDFNDMEAAFQDLQF